MSAFGHKQSGCLRRVINARPDALINTANNSGIPLQNPNLCRNGCLTLKFRPWRRGRKTRGNGKTKHSPSGKHLKLPSTYRQCNFNYFIKIKNEHTHKHIFTNLMQVGKGWCVRAHDFLCVCVCISCNTPPPSTPFFLPSATDVINEKGNRINAEKLVGAEEASSNSEHSTPTSYKSSGFSEYANPSAVVLIVLKRIANF